MAQNLMDGVPAGRLKIVDLPNENLEWLENYISADRVRQTGGKC